MPRNPRSLEMVLWYIQQSFVKESTALYLPLCSTHESGISAFDIDAATTHRRHAPICNSANSFYQPITTDIFTQNDAQNLTAKKLTWSGMSLPKLFSKFLSYPSLPGMITRRAERRNSKHIARHGRAGDKVHRPPPPDRLPWRAGRAGPSTTRRPKKGPDLAGLSGTAICFVWFGKFMNEKKTMKFCLVRTGQNYARLPENFLTVLIVLQALHLLDNVLCRGYLETPVQYPCVNNPTYVAINVPVLQPILDASCVYTYWGGLYYSINLGKLFASLRLLYILFLSHPRQQPPVRPICELHY